MRVARNQMEEWMNDRYLSTAHTIAMRYGHEHEMRIFQSDSVPSTGSSLAIFVHAEGFAMGTTFQPLNFAQGYSNSHGVTVINVTHCLVPEHVFPAAALDVWDTAKWLSANAVSLSADPLAGFNLGGVLSGANLAAVTAQRAATEG